MKFTIQNKLLTGFGVVLLLASLVSINNFIEVEKISTIEKRITTLRLPTDIAGMRLIDGIHASLSGLHGYMLLGQDPALATEFKAERLEGWNHIDAAIQELDVFARDWNDSNNINSLQKIKGLLRELRHAQQTVEDISHTSKNTPALTMLLTEAIPRASISIDAINTLLTQESRLVFSPERKALLIFLTDSRNSLNLSLSDIRDYVLTGKPHFKDKFHDKWQLNEKRFKQLSAMSDLFSAKQSIAWRSYRNSRAEFSLLPEKIFKLRDTSKGNVANDWLVHNVSAKAKDIMLLVEHIHDSQVKQTKEDQDTLNDEITSMKFVMIIGLVIILGVGIFTSIFISQLIVTPLKQVVGRAKEIANGNLSNSALALKGDDEITELTVAINNMSSSLQSIIEQVSGSSQQIASSTLQLSSVTEQTSQNIYEQQAQTEQVATAMNQMSATVEEVSKHIIGTSQAAQEANTETSEGRKMVDDSIQAIQHLAGQIENTADVIHQLEQDSENIGTVLDVIRGIAEQTNLLALNAAIEAARAGEQGRGFAVVADEVRTLAGRTQEATAEINQVIEKLQNGSRKAVEVMNNSREEAQSVVEQSTKAGSSLSVISTAVERINDMSTQIASAAEQQNLTANEINRNVTNISEIAYETANGAKNTTEATESLSQLAVELKGLVEQFKI